MNWYILLRKLDCTLLTHMNAQLFQAIYLLLYNRKKLNVAVFLLSTNCMYPVAGQVEI